jgi:hypothetical protein
MRDWVASKSGVEVLVGSGVAVSVGMGVSGGTGVSVDHEVNDTGGGGRVAVFSGVAVGAACLIAPQPTTKIVIRIILLILTLGLIKFPEFNVLPMFSSLNV